MKLNTEINDCQPKNHLLDKNNFENGKQELWKNLRFYIDNTIKAEDSPWSENSDPATSPYYQNKKLSILQKQIISFLHKKYFRNSFPAYVKVTTLADQMQVPRSSIQRAIKRLVKRKILLRFYLFFHNKENNDYKERAILLPHNPLKVKLNHRIKYLDNKRSPQSKDEQDFCQMPFSNRFNMLNTKRKPQMANGSPFLEGRGYRLISKLQKSLQGFRHIIYYIYSINTLYSSLLVSSSKENSKTSFYSEFPDGNSTPYETPSFSSNERTKPMKRIPRYKLNSIPDKPTLINKTHLDFSQLVSSNDFDFFTLPENQKGNVLNYVAQHTYDFEFEKVFSNKKLNTRQAVAKKNTNTLLSFYFELFFSGEPLNTDTTDKILTYWNAIDNPKFTKHKINHESITYIETMILTNYILKFNCDNDITQFFKIIDNIDQFGNQNFFLRDQTRKWGLNKIPLYHKKHGLKKYFKAYKNRVELKKAIFNDFKVEKKYQGAAKRWKEIFVDSFYRTKKEKGENIFEENRSRLLNFLITLCNEVDLGHKTTRLNLYGRSLTQQTSVKNPYGEEWEPPILEEYCDWYGDWIQRKPNLDSFVSLENWMRFVRDEIRGVRGMNRFWYPMK